MSADVVWKVPQVHGKLSNFKEELMEGVGELECGNERFRTRQYLPGLPDLGRGIGVTTGKDGSHVLTRCERRGQYNGLYQVQTL